MMTFLYGGTDKCKENGKLRIEGKDYIVQDGDVYTSGSILDQTFFILK